MNIIATIAATHPILFWASIGVILIIVEVITISGLFLSFSASAFILAGLSWLNIPEVGFLWKIMIFFVLGVLLIPVLRSVMRKFFDRTPDINDF
jgi:membrane protein implicated in regulation of membrane protease activity